MEKQFAFLLIAAGALAETGAPAFPGAEGAGMWATGGRGCAVYRVTNLKTSGPDSLAGAVSAPNRFVVFAVSGIIDLGEGKPGGPGKITIAHPNITVAGQTAPGEGITIVNGSVNVTAGNVILQHLRVRRGQIAKGNRGDAFGIKGDFENVMLDHLSASWATDENLTLTNANNVTAQYSISAEALDYFNPPQTPPRHSFGSLFGSKYDDGRMTIHHSLYAHNRLRDARTTAGGRARYVHVPVPPGKADRMVLEIVASRDYRIGCPGAALVAVQDGHAPVPVRLQDLEPRGGATPEDLAGGSGLRHEQALCEDAAVNRAGY